MVGGGAVALFLRVGVIDGVSSKQHVAALVHGQYLDPLFVADGAIESSVGVVPVVVLAAPRELQGVSSAAAFDVARARGSPRVVHLRQPAVAHRSDRVVFFTCVTSKGREQQVREKRNERK